MNPVFPLGNSGSVSVNSVFTMTLQNVTTVCAERVNCRYKYLRTYIVCVYIIYNMHICM